jgi:translocation and assembly module TamB
MRYLRRLLIAIVLVPTLGVGAAFLWLQTDTGHGQLIRWIESATSQGSTRISIGSVDGTVPFDMRVSELQLSDDNGPWLQAKQVHLHFSGLALLARRLKIDALSADLVSLQRLPQTAATQSATGSQGGIPSLPLDVELANASIARLDLGSPVLGQAMAFTVDTQATVLRLGDLSARLALHRIDGPGGSDDVSADLAYQRAADHLMVNLAIAEPTGGLVSRLLGLPAGRKLVISGKGDAPLADWRGSLVATLDDAPLLQLTGSSRGKAADRQIQVDMQAQAAELLPEAIRPFARGGLHASTSIRILSDAEPTRLQIDRLQAKSDTLDLSAEGAVALDGTGDLRWHVTSLSSDATAKIVPQLRWKSAMFEGQVAGKWQQPTGHVTGRVSTLQYRGNTLGDLALSIDASPGATSAAPIGIKTTIVGSDIAPADTRLAPLVKDGIRLTMTGGFDQRGQIDIGNLTIDTGALAFHGQGRATGWGDQFDVSGALQARNLKDFSDLSGLPLKGNLLITAEANRSASNAQLTLDGVAADSSFGEPSLDGLLGPAPRLKLKMVQPTGGPAELQQLTLAGKALQLDATGLLNPAAARIDVTGTINGLASIDPRLQGKLAMQAEINGAFPHLAVTGNISSAKLTADAVVGTDMALYLKIPDLATRNGIALTAKGFINGLPLAIASDVNLPSGGDHSAIELTALQFRLGRSSVTGRGQVQDQLITGQLGLAIPELAELASLTQIAATGSLTGDIKLTAIGRRQSVSASLSGKALSLGKALAIGHLQATADATDVFATPALALHVSLDDARMSKQQLQHVEARLDGPITRLTYDLHGVGPRIEAKIAGTLSHRPEQDSIIIDKAMASAAGQRVTLLHPATITRRAGNVHLDQLVLQSGAAQVILTGEISPDGNRAKLDVTHLASDQLAALLPQLPVKGDVSGHVMLSGTTKDPQAVADLRIDQLASNVVPIPPSTATARADWRNGHLSAEAKIDLAGQNQSLLLAAQLPVPADPASGFPRLNELSELTATAKGHLDLALANALLPSSVDHVGGQADVDLTLTGSLAAPDLHGRLVVVDGRYENLRYGTRIRAIQAIITATGTRLEVTSFSAKTPGNGSLSAAGDIDLTRTEPVAIKIRASNAQLINNAMASAAADADVTIASLDSHQVEVAGKVKIIKAEIRIPDSFSNAVQEIAVDERNVEAKTGAPMKKAAEAAPPASTDRPTRLTINMSIDAPQQVAVRGRGLDAELGGQLHLSGDVARPALTGQLKLRRGKLDLVGRSLNFDRGTISFDGGTPIDPQLDFAAKSKANSYDITATVGGTATKPSLALISSPALPQDEILAQLLFGRAAGSLSAIQAVQLAQATAELAGVSGGPDILDNLRRATGLDRLSVDAGENKTTTSAAVGPSLSAGRYVAPGVYLGVKQGTKADTSAATVEIDVTTHVKVETDVGGSAGSKAGVNMQWDY